MLGKTHNPVGASLLAKALGQLVKMSNVPTLSRAGSLPPGNLIARTVPFFCRSNHDPSKESRTRCARRAVENP
ncbi:hypothetical protein DMX03_08530 [Pseudomonas koreensis]|nr:hypothetical protein DMX03_08530 [Pseudomonas koreensis]